MRTNPTTRLLAFTGALVLTGASLVGCQSPARRSDAFGQAADRPPTPRTLHMMARLIHENGRGDQAEYVLTRIITESPEYLPAYVELADLHIEHQRYDEARDTLRTAHGIAPNDTVIANNLGVLLLREGSFVEASEAFSQAALNDPDEARFHANLAVSLAMQGRFEEAYHAWAMVLPPEQVFWNMAVVAEANGDQAAADKYYVSANLAKKGVPPYQRRNEFARPGKSTVETATVSVPVD